MSFSSIIKNGCKRTVLTFLIMCPILLSAIIISNNMGYTSTLSDDHPVNDRKSYYMNSLSYPTDALKSSRTSALNFDLLQTSSNIPLPQSSAPIDSLNFGSDLDAPLQGNVSGAGYNIFWFIHICDTQNVWFSQGRLRDTDLFFNTTCKVIQPTFVFNTGDLVGSDYDSFFLRNPGQMPEEWQSYNDTLAKNEVNSTFYFDMIGNHDIYRDPGFSYFMNYSMTGSTYNTLQMNVNLEYPWGKYSFYTLSTPEDTGLEYPFALSGIMNATELEWFESKLKQNTDSNVSFAFGHHPPFEVVSALSPEGNFFIPLMQKYGVDTYLCGHGHINSYQKIGSLAAIETDRFTDKSGCYRIVAVDNDGISSSYQIGKQWPVGIITHPVSIYHAFGDYDMGFHANPTQIRALAWDPEGIASVSWRSDGGEWTSMTHDSGPTWIDAWDSTLSDAQKHIIEVNITNIDGISKIEQIEYLSIEAKFFGWEQAIPIIIFSFVGIVFVLPITKHYLNTHKPERFGKKERDITDKKLRTLVLVKALVLLFAPMVLTEIFNESITVMFSFFLLSSIGPIFTDVTLLFMAIPMVLAVLPLSLNMSSARMGRMFFWLFIAIAVELFCVVFYILHFTISIIAPGYYAMIVLDVVLMKRVVQMHHEADRSHPI